MEIVSVYRVTFLTYNKVHLPDSLIPMWVKKLHLTTQLIEMSILNLISKKSPVNNFKMV